MVGDKTVSLKVKTKNYQINISDKALNQSASNDAIFNLGKRLGQLHIEEVDEIQKIIETEIA